MLVIVLATPVVACGMLSGADDLYVGDGDAATGASSSTSSSSSSGGATSSGAPRSYRDVVLADKPASYWRLGDPSGTHAKDERGDNDGRVVGAIGFGAPGAIEDGDPAMSFRTQGGYIDVGPDFDVDEPITFEAWLKADAPGAALSNVIEGSSGIRLYATDGTIAADLCAPNGDGCRTVAMKTSLPTDWLHVVVARDDRSVILYVGGTERARASIGAKPRSTSTPLYIGASHSGDERWNGSIDDVAVYLRALPADRIAAHFAAR